VFFTKLLLFAPVVQLLFHASCGNWYVSASLSFCELAEISSFAGLVFWGFSLLKSPLANFLPFVKKSFSQI